MSPPIRYQESTPILLVDAAENVFVIRPGQSAILLSSGQDFVTGDTIPVHDFLDSDLGPLLTASTTFVLVGYGGYLFAQFLADVPAAPPGWEVVFRVIARCRNDVGGNGVETRLFNNTTAAAVTNSLVSNTSPVPPFPAGQDDTYQSVLMRLTDVPSPLNSINSFAVQLRAVTGGTARLIGLIVRAYWRKT